MGVLEKQRMTNASVISGAQTMACATHPPGPTYRRTINLTRETEAGNGEGASSMVILPEDVGWKWQEVEKSCWGWVGKPQGKWSLPRWLLWQLWPCPLPCGLAWA